MPQKGFHGTYLGGHSIIRAHPVGVEPRSNRRIDNGLVWTADTPRRFNGELNTTTPIVRLLSAQQAKKLLHKTVRPMTYFGVSGATKIIFSELKIQECKALLGAENRGFGIFSNSINSRLERFKSASLTEIADALNASGWKTFNGLDWNWTLLGVFIQLFGKQKKPTRANLKAAKRKMKSPILK